MYVFESDISLKRPEETAPPGLQIKIYEGVANTEIVRDAIEKCGSDRGFRAQPRLSRGDVAVVPEIDGEPVGFAWLTFRDAWVPELELMMKIPEGWVLHADAFVAPRWRGRRINVLMLMAAKEEAARRGCTHSTGYILSRNYPSMRLEQRWNAGPKMKVAFFRFRGAKRGWQYGWGARLESRFRAAEPGERS